MGHHEKSDCKCSKHKHSSTKLEHKTAKAEKKSVGTSSSPNFIYSSGPSGATTINPGNTAVLADFILQVGAQPTFTGVISAYVPVQTVAPAIAVAMIMTSNAPGFVPTFTKTMLTGSGNVSFNYAGTIIPGYTYTLTIANEPPVTAGLFPIYILPNGCNISAVFL